MKRCCTCKSEKPVGEFGRNARSPDGLQKRCRVCSREASANYYLRNKDKAQLASRSWQDRNKEHVYAKRKEWREANPDRLAAYRRRSHLASRGLSAHDFDQMVEAQSGCCAICGSSPGPQGLCIDHDHSCCSKGCSVCVRALLCRSCNTGLGLFKDDPTLLIAASSYLVSYGSSS